MEAGQKSIILTFIILILHVEHRHNLKYYLLVQLTKSDLSSLNLGGR